MGEHVSRAANYEEGTPALEETSSSPGLAGGQGLFPAVF